MVLPENYTLEKKPIKHARIRVSENLSVRVLVPLDFTSHEVNSLLVKKKKWIEKHLNHFNRKKGKINLHQNQLLILGNRYSYFYKPELYHKIVINHNHKTIQAKIDLLATQVQTKWYKKFARQFITQRVMELARKHRFKYNKVFIRNQRTKWGNCSVEKNLSFNWRLIKTPPFVIDYLIIHELLHTRVMNHTQKFWTQLKSYCPEYRAAVEWLDKYGNGL